jgi:hypothetical protein
VFVRRGDASARSYIYIPAANPSRPPGCSPAVVPHRCPTALPFAHSQQAQVPRARPTCGQAEYAATSLQCLYCRVLRPAHPHMQIAQRYAWVDLTAGPITHGPHSRCIERVVRSVFCLYSLCSGAGLINDASIPSLDVFRCSIKSAMHAAVYNTNPFLVSSIIIEPLSCFICNLR